MELVKRYIYAVTKKLPEQQKADIEKELKGLIEDMLEDRAPAGHATREDVEAVLLELGDPGELADKYRGTRRYLIGPDLFDTYLSVLKIVVIAITIAMTALFSVESIVNPTHVLDQFVSYIVDLIISLFQGFTWVTLIFGVAEYKGVHRSKQKSKTSPSWEPTQLPPLPTQLTRIKRSDPIASIIFTILFAALFLFSLELFGVWFFQEGGPRVVVPFFNEEVMRRFVPLVGIALALSLVKDVVKMITGKWTIALIGFDILVSILHFIVALFMFADKSVWNPAFMQQLASSRSLAAGSEALRTAGSIWERAQDGIIIAIGLVIAVEVITLLIKLFKIKNVS
ncbi:hypothetical protein GCM10010912_69410 [Paenibacillus albidus]|uniref:Uncharacterized protein n=1 Tax=Paenibacillus albidus TaxID=2041023 RepID=A0A917FZC9_9BACL|nr:hypothetical protein [Paenibacillus albidus]GGG15122.1 hypothetical protein GCM10010912_69410 [Paenibacillus albidus]